jgi:mannan endo-1,4-beta-mannosidase
MKIPIFGVFALVAAGLCTCLAQPVPSTLQNFITRRGAELYDGDKQFRFMGSNMPGLVLPYDFTLRLPERMQLPTPWEQEDGVRTAVQMGLRVVRLWSLPMRRPSEKAQPWHYILSPGEFNEAAFRTLDHLLVLGNRYGVRFVVAFSENQDCFLGGFEDYSKFRGRTRAEFFTDPQVREDYKTTVRYILNRRNTETGTRYLEDPAVFAWEFGNEIQSATDGWLREMAAYIKSIDTRHLILDTRSHLLKAPLEVDPNIDIYNIHLYGGDWSKTNAEFVDMLGGRRPLLVGEYGPYFTRPEEGPAALERQRTLLNQVIADRRISGALLWSMYFHHRDGGFKWHQIMTYPQVWSYHWPGFPGGEGQRETEVLADLRSAAYRIQGLQPPSVPIPDVPELLPFGGTPQLSWRGSAGAAGYDIERATSAKGPWTTVAANVPDSETAYRPLWTDTTAQAGTPYFYRVAARNKSGQSAFSKPAGPAIFQELCLVDELADLKLTAAHEGDIQIANDFNALYAEYLYRAKASKGAALSWQVPGDIREISVWVFFAGEPVTPFLSVAPAGSTSWARLDAAAERRDLSSPPTGPASKEKRVLVRYDAKVRAGNRQFRMEWAGISELDRVEIRYR